MNFSESFAYQGDGRFVQHMMAMQNISKLTFRPEDKVLDVGCGTGEETKAMATNVKSITAVDISSEMLAVARKINAAPNITYSTGDACTVGDNPNWLGNFDKVVCFYVLHWIPDGTKAQALRSILACLKPGGEALLIVANRFPLVPQANFFTSSHEKWGDYVKGFVSSYYVWNRSAGESKELLEACGWTDIKCDLQYLSPMAKMQTKLYFQTVLAIYTRIPEADREAYLEDLWQWMLSQFPDKTQAGYVCIPTEMMVIHASKPS